MTKPKGPKVLFFDIETAPMLAYVWALWDQNVALNQIHTDWYILSWAAKWLGSKEVLYMDQRNVKNMEDDSKILSKIWKLLDQADIVVTQNGKQFDVKKLNARFILNGFQPPSSFKHIDTLEIAKRNFGFTSNKLAYMSEKLCKKYKKLSHAKFAGFDMWKECLKRNKAAWAEMKVYNTYDVLALEELYHKIVPWDSSINFNLYHDSTKFVCKCGSDSIIKNGFFYSSTGKYARFRCQKCGSEVRGNRNEFSKEKRLSLLKPVRR